MNKVSSNIYFVTFPKYRHTKIKGFLGFRAFWPKAQKDKDNGREDYSN